MPVRDIVIVNIKTQTQYYFWNVALNNAIFAKNNISIINYGTAGIKSDGDPGTP